MKNLNKRITLQGTILTIHRKLFEALRAMGLVCSNITFHISKTLVSLVLHFGRKLIGTICILKTW